MKRDPAFLFYDGDAARDVSHMNRLERGCYFDLIQAQRKFGGFTVEQARKILGKDFDTCWDAISLILIQNNGLYYIEWVHNSINDRAEFAERQRKRIQDYWDKKKHIPRNNRGNSTDIPCEGEDEDEIINEDVIEEIYKLYPRKEGKARGIKKLRTAIKSKETLDKFKRAVINYADYCAAKGTEEKFIKQFSTFCNEDWKDWIEPKSIQEDNPFGL